MVLEEFREKTGGGGGIPFLFYCFEGGGRESKVLHTTKYQFLGLFYFLPSHRKINISLIKQMQIFDQ